MLKTFSLLLLVVLASRTETILINSSQQLEWQLQRLSQINTLQLVLDSSVQYQLTNDSFSYFINKNITIQSNNNQTANISCINNNTGIAFIDSTVTIIGISLKKCGSHLALLPDNVTDRFNNTSPLYYSSNSAAVLLLVECKVTIDTVIIESSFGFAIVGYNLRSSQFQCLTVRNLGQKHDSQETGSGSGMLIHFSDSKNQLTTPTILLNNNVFENNEEYYNGSYCISDTYNYYYYNNRSLLQNAAGLTILYTQNSYTVNTVIQEGRFKNNSGKYAGGCLILHYKTNVTSTTRFNRSNFQSNSYYSHSVCHGVALQYLWLKDSPSVVTDSLVIENTQFKGAPSGQKTHHITGAVYIGIYSSHLRIHFHFKTMTCCNNHSPGVGGICLMMELSKQYGNGSTVSVTMTNITAINNSNTELYVTPTNIFLFRNIKAIYFTGISVFNNNQGTVIFTEECHLYLYGQMTFMNNTALKGGAIRLEGNGVLHFMEGLSAQFTNNHAYISGGAIYVDSNFFIDCAIQAIRRLNINISFIDNEAKMAGNAIFASPIYNCKNNRQYRTKWVKEYKKLFNFHQQNNTSVKSISTYPYKFHVHYTDSNESLYKKIPRLFPGETLFLRTSATDKSNRAAFSFVNIEIFDVENNLWLKRSGGTYVTEGANNTSLNISVHTKSETSKSAILLFSLPKSFSRTYKIELRECPLGFRLNPSSGRCVCSRIIKELLPGTHCSIDKQLITIPTYINPWIGTIGNELALSTVCPLNYCNNDPFYSTNVKVTNKGFVRLNSPHKFCGYKRSGTMCGQCIENHTLVFGSHQCMEFHHKCYLYSLPLVIIILIVTGLALIFLIYALKLTLTKGTLNGIIFYAQIANAGLVEEILTVNNEHPNRYIHGGQEICRSFLSILNLHIGFPLCFFNGMNQLWKISLTLVFPVYLLSIVAVIIIISRYSTWLSNRTSHSSIQVLVTVVHLSFSQLLVTLTDVFTPATVYTANDTRRVWYWDGSVSFMGRSHIILGMITMIIVGTIIVPYLGLLLFGNILIRRYSKASFYLRPILEAIHAPYKERKQYWFTARLLLVILVYAIYIGFRQNAESRRYLIIFSTLMLFLFGQAMLQPFKHKLLNTLDTWLVINITLVYIALYKGTYKVSSIINIVAVMLVMVTCILIISYHVISVTGCYKKIRLKILNTRRYNTLTYISDENTPLVENEQQLEETDSFHYCDSSNRYYREPLIASEDY